MIERIVAPAPPIIAGLILLLGPGVAVAQETWDAHAVTVEAYEPGQVPEARVLGGQRLAFAAPGAPRAEVVAQYGRMEGVERLELVRQHQGRLSLEVSYRFARFGRGSMSHGFHSGPIIGKIGPGIRGWPATFIFLRRVQRPEDPLAPWAVTDAVASAARGVIGAARPGDALEFLARLPLSLHLDLQDREALLAWLERARISDDSETQAQARAVRLLAGDVDVALSWDSRDWRQRVWMAEALGISFSLARDPELKGLFGWRAVHGGEQRKLIPALATAIESGKAVLPGEPEVRAQRTREILHLAAASRVTWPLLGVGLCAAAMIALVLLLRFAARALT